MELSPGDGGFHLGDVGRDVAAVEYCTAGDNEVGLHGGELADVVFFDGAIDVTPKD